MESKKEYLKKRIIETVFKKEEIQKVAGFSGSNTQWLMDFKASILDPDFAEAYISLLRGSFKGLGNFQVCGLESGAIPLITIARTMIPECKNAFYIRKSRKKSDLANLIEGEIKDGLPIIVLDDILNRGESLLKQVVILKGLGVSPHSFLSIIRYRDVSHYRQNFEFNFNIETIFELNDFKNELGITNLISNSSNTDRFLSWEGLWKVRLSDFNPYHVIPKSAPCYDSDYIFMGSDDGVMRAIRKDDGLIVWERRIAFRVAGKAIYSSPVVSKGKVFFGAYDGNFYCLDSNTGEILWVFMDADWIGSSPAVSSDGKVVYIGLEFGLFKKKGGVAAIDTETGKAKWTYYQMEGLTHASPAVSDRLGVVVCGCNDEYVYCFNSRNGKFLWRYKTEGEVKYGAIFDEKKGQVIIASMDGKVYVLNTKDGSVHYTFQAKSGFYSNPLCLGDEVIIGSLDKFVYCFDKKLKRELWRFETQGRIFSSPAYYGGSVFVGSNDGRLYEIDSNSGKLKSLTQLSERIINKVCIEKSGEFVYIYVPTHACELYKFRNRINLKN